MRRHAAKFTAVFAVHVAACNSQSPTEPTDPVELERADWQLVDRDYPFRGEHGELVCAEWERPAVAGPERIELEREFYHPDVMNRLLDGAPLPGEEMGAEVREAIRSAGIRSVETCEDARRFTQIEQDRLESEPFVPEHDAASAEKAPEPGTATDEPSVEEVEKVIDGQVFSNPPTVFIRKWTAAGAGLGHCSGTLIGPAHILTAAHCFPADGSYRVSILTQQSYCVSSNQPPPGPNVHCSDMPTAANVTVTRKPGYTGTSDTGDDMAIVRHTAGTWLSPANTSASWMRVNNMTGALSANYWVSGYGASTWNGGGYGTGRIALQAQAVDWAGQQHWYSVRDAFGVGAACAGDSGGPAIHTNFGFDLNVGVFSNLEVYGGHSCPSVEGDHKFRYASPGSAGAWIDSTVTAGGGLCTDYVYNGVWHYLRCW